MSRKYSAEDFKYFPKPRIHKTKRFFVDRFYNWRCIDDVTHSQGYGTTPKDAYNAWLRNYNRRAKYYQAEARQSAAVLRFHARRRL